MDTTHAVSPGSFTCQPLQATRTPVLSSQQHNCKVTIPSPYQNTTFPNKEPHLYQPPVSVNVQVPNCLLDDIPFIDE